MAKILKHGREESLRREDDAKVQQIVSDIIRDIEERGDAAVKNTQQSSINSKRTIYV